jgi:MSP (Major sperm protein) domain
VKTTQPRRYLVRPNQGLIQPGSFEHVQILLVEKDKTSLLQSYQRLGQSALDQSKDKFLVQSIAIDSARSKTLQDYEKLTALWTSVTSTGSNISVTNKKLSVKLTVDVNAGTTSVAPGMGPGASSNADPTKLSQEQLVSELSGLRRKYDELVAFSVNLTAERDILNNTLEQTKRDLNRQIAKSAANDNSNVSKQQVTRRNGSRTSTPNRPLRIVSSLLQVLVLFAAVFFGAYLQDFGYLAKFPFVQRMVLPNFDNIVRVVLRYQMNPSKKPQESETLSDSKIYREEL